MNDRKRSRILTSDKEPNKRQRQTDDISTRFQNPSGVPFAYKSSDLNTIEREGYVQRIGYSERYYDDNMEYRHVILPKPLFRLVPTVYKNVLLVEHDWRSLGITMSAGWVHYLIHRPEPHVFLFRREKYYQEKYGNGLKPVLQTSYSHIDNDQTNDTKQNAKIERRKILNGKCLAREKENSVDSEGEHVESGEESESEIGQANPFPFYDLPSLVKFLQQSMRNADVMLRLNNEINFNDHMESASKHLNASLVDRDIPARHHICMYPTIRGGEDIFYPYDEDGVPTSFPDDLKITYSNDTLYLHDIINLYLGLPYHPDAPPRFSFLDAIYRNNEDWLHRWVPKPEDACPVEQWRIAAQLYDICHYAMVNYNVSDHYELSRLVHASDKKIPGIMWLKNKDLKTIPGVGDVNRPSFRCAKDVINFFKLHFNNPELAYTVPIYPHDTMFENNDRSDILTPDRIDDRIVEQGRAFACYNESGLEGVFDPFPAGNKRSLGLLKNDFWVFTDFEYIHEVVDNWNGAGEFALDQVPLGWIASHHAVSLSENKRIDLPVDLLRGVSRMRTIVQIVHYARIHYEVTADQISAAVHGIDVKKLRKERSLKGPLIPPIRNLSHMGLESVKTQLKRVMKTEKTAQHPFSGPIYPGPHLADAITRAFNKSTRELHKQNAHLKNKAWSYNGRDQFKPYTPPGRQTPHPPPKGYEFVSPVDTPLQVLKEWIGDNDGKPCTPVPTGWLDVHFGTRWAEQEDCVKGFLWRRRVVELLVCLKLNFNVDPEDISSEIEREYYALCRDRFAVLDEFLSQGDDTGDEEDLNIAEDDLASEVAKAGAGKKVGKVGDDGCDYDSMPGTLNGTTEGHDSSLGDLEDFDKEDGETEGSLGDLEDSDEGVEGTKGYSGVFEDTEDSDEEDEEAEYYNEDFDFSN